MISLNSKILGVLGLVFGLIIFAANMAVANDSTVQSRVAEAKSKVANEAKKDAAASYDDFIKKIEDFENSEDYKAEILSKSLTYDVNIGNLEAPVQIVEYASLGCIHCKQFHKDVFYDLKKNYIDDGKIGFKFRHFPLNAPALSAM